MPENGNGTSEMIRRALQPYRPYDARFDMEHRRLVRDHDTHHFNVIADFGARGDGVTDDTVPIQRALNAALAAGGGIVFVPAGTYLLSIAMHPNSTSLATALMIPAGVTLRGAGTTTTTLKLGVVANAVPSGCIANWQLHIVSTTYTTATADVVCEDLTIDGNAANQTFVAPNAAHALNFARVRGGWISRVRVKNFYGTTPGPPTETMHFECLASTDIHYTDCEAVSDTAIQTSTGFSANVSTGVEYVGCVARGMINGMGFTNWTSALIRYVNCHAYLNGYAGFNTEISEYITYVGCHAGGRAATFASAILSSGLNLGNQFGFKILGSSHVQIMGGAASDNATGTGAGVYVSAYTGPVNSSSVFIDGLTITRNKYGIWVDASQTSVRTSSLVTLSGNTTADFGGAGSIDEVIRRTTAPIETWDDINGVSGARFNVTGGATFAYRWLLNGTEILRLLSTGAFGVLDGITAPTAATGIAFVYVDTADGDFKVRYADGTTKTLSTDAVDGTLETWGTDTAGNVTLIINTAAGQSRSIIWRSAGLNRWILQVDNTAESGSDAGSDLAIFAYDDAGNFLFTPFKLIRATGEVQMSGTVRPAGGVNVSATGAMLVSGGSAPESSVTQPVGSVFLNANGSALTTAYVKESGSGNTGWRAVMTLDTGGDLQQAAGGYRQTIDGWFYDNLGTGVAATEMTRLVGRFRAARAGSVTAVIITSTEARTAGTCTATVFKNTGLAGAAGATIGLTAVLDGTNTSRKATTQAKDTDTFAAGDEIYAVIESDGSWTPTSADIRVAVEIED